MKGSSLALGAAIVAGLGAVAGTIWIGSLVKEETVVGDPYEDGLRYDAERRARADLGWDVRLVDAPHQAGPAALTFTVLGPEGRAVAGATVDVLLHRPETSRQARTFQTRETAPGTYAGEVRVPAAGAWQLVFDVRRGTDRLRIEKVLAVQAACDAGLASCTRTLDGGGEATLELRPRPVRTMDELTIVATVSEDGRPLAGPVSVAFEMTGMDMGVSRVTLAPEAPGRFVGKAVLVRCPSGRKVWTSKLTLAAPGAAPRTARFEFTVAE